MAKIQADQIEVGAGPQHSLPKYGPGPGWELVASRISDTGTAIDIPGRSVKVGDVALVNNGTGLELDDAAKAAFLRAAKSPFRHAKLEMDCFDAGQALLSAVESGTTAALWLDPGNDVATLGFTPTNAGTLNVNAGIINLNPATQLTKNGIDLGVVESVSLTAQTANASEILGVPGIAGLFRISYYLVITTAGTSGTVKATFTWTDPAGDRSVDSATLTFGTLAEPVSGTLIVRSSGTANIIGSTLVTDPVGDPEYALYITLERLQ